MKPKDSKYADKQKKKRRPSLTADTEHGDNEVRLYIPEEYKARVYDSYILERLHEVASFTTYEAGKGITRFVSAGKLDKLRSVVNVLEQVYRLLSETDDITDRELEHLIEENFKNSNDEQYKWNKDAIFEDFKGRYFTPRTDNQKDLVDSIRKNAITIVEGAAGTGKSRIALIMGLNLLKDNRVNKIIIIRPLVAVGGDIGYLPGGVDEKIGPYQAPISDALVELIGKETYETYLENEKIEIYPAAFARGCNISDSFVVVDEAQNFDSVTLLTLLTRICANTKMVLTGDATQDDRKSKHREESGLSIVKRKLVDVSNIGIVNMGIGDVQRSKIVKDILTSFEE